LVKFIFYEILDFKLKYYTTMSFIAPYAFTGAVSIYLGYKTYTSYYSNSEFEELGSIEEKDEEQNIKEVVDQLVESIIQDAVEKIEEEREKILSREDLEEETDKNDIRINKVIEDVKKEENVQMTNYDNIVNVVNKTLEKMDKQEGNIEEQVLVVEPEVKEVDTNNPNVVEEIVKSPIRAARNHNNLKKRKKRKQRR
jgi:hypothetical protein